jgi:hypothetical protein
VPFLFIIRKFFKNLLFLLRQNNNFNSNMQSLYDICLTRVKSLHYLPTIQLPITIQNDFENVAGCCLRRQQHFYNIHKIIDLKKLHLLINETCKRGHLSCLQDLIYADINGTQGELDVNLNNVTHLSFWSTSNAGLFAAKNGHLKCLQFLFTKTPIKFDSHSVELAAENGHIECLQFLHQSVKCFISSAAVAQAIWNGHLHCVRYAIENGAQWHTSSLWIAASNGSLRCLKYAHENGAPRNCQPCDGAAEFGNLECLKFLHQNNYPWNANTIHLAARTGKLQCLKYAHENGCPWDATTTAAAYWLGHYECYIYAVQNGCPCFVGM